MSIINTDENKDVKEDILIITCLIPCDKNDKNNNSLYKKFLTLAYDNTDNLYNESRIVSTEEFKDDYKCLSLGNGGSWCRMDSTFSKKRKYVLRKANGQLTYSWIPTEIEKEKINKDFFFLEVKNDKGNSITHIKVYGIKDSNEYLSRYIRPDIREYFKNSKCVVCGNGDIEIDHKNGLYNDKRVLDSKTQVIDDFQPLCRHCNQRKRQSIIVTKNTKKRYKATDIPQMSIWGIDFILGNEEYDENDINAMVGTYWYDPIAFMNFIKMKYISHL